MSSHDELSSGPERLTVLGANKPEAITEELKDAPVTALDDERPQAPLVLDASFVHAVPDGEPAAMRLVDLLRGSVLLSPTAGELYLQVAERSRLPPAQVEAVLIAYGVRLIDLPTAATHHFPELRRIDAARRQEAPSAGGQLSALSLGDLCVLGCAQHVGLPVLVGDRHWKSLHTLGPASPVYLCRRTAE